MGGGIESLTALAIACEITPWIESTSASSSDGGRTTGLGGLRISRIWPVTTCPPMSAWTFAQPARFSSSSKLRWSTTIGGDSTTRLTFTCPYGRAVSALCAQCAAHKDLCGGQAADPGWQLEAGSGYP